MLREQHATQPFEIALIDMHMPDIPGDALGRAIRQNPDLARLHLAMLTSATGRGEAQRLSQLGFDAYLVKPVKPRTLYDAIRLVAARPEANRNQPASMVTRHSATEAWKPVKRSARILLVEDNPVNQKVASTMLRRFVEVVDMVSDGQQAIEALSNKQYDLVFMDCQMPVCDGYEATRIIRNPESTVKNHNIPVVAMTANAMFGDREKCLQEGMSDYITKPIRQQDLAEVFDRWLPAATHQPA